MADTPPIQRFDHWTLVSRDVERSKRFYTEILGAQEREASEGPASVTLAGTIIDLFPTIDQWGWQPSPGSGGQHHAYIIKLEDCEPWLEHFRTHNVPTRLMAHGLIRISIYVDDPDGYHIELTVPFEDPEFARREIAKRGLLQDVDRRPPWRR